MQDLMQPIDTSDKVFHDGNPAIGELGTIVPAKWLNNVQGAVRNLQSELLTVLGSAELASDPLKQDQLKQAIAKVYAPLESPALTGTPTAPTAAMNDSSKKVATTEFVRSLIGNFKNVININSSGVLTADQVGSDVYINGSNNGIVTLPAISSVMPGGVFSIHTTSDNVAIKIAGNDVIFANGQVVDLKSIILNSGEGVVLVARGDGRWHLVSDAGALRYARGFEASLTTNGYQKLPSGLLMQWVTVSGATYSTPNTFMRKDFSWPIAFSAKPFCVASEIETGIAGAVFVNSSIEGRTAAGATWVYSAGAPGVSPIISVFALGTS